MISILMATYDGEAYISQQIESILSQTVQDFTLYIRDDGSNDRTAEIISEYASAYPGKILPVGDGSASGGSKHNFFILMSEIRDDYLMLCDQDDIWLSDKIEKTLAKMREMEKRFGKAMPILVHTDLEVVDQDLRRINQSFKKAMNADYTRTQLKDLVIQNTLTGCTAMYNRALSELIIAKPDYMVMHDWWLVLLAGTFGKIAHIDDRTILYRQHSSNQIGAKDVRTIRYKLDRLFHGDHVREAIRVTYPQAESLLRLYKDRLSDSQARVLEEYCSIPRKDKLMRCLSVLRLRTFKTGFSRNIAYFLFL